MGWIALEDAAPKDGDIVDVWITYVPQQGLHAGKRIGFRAVDCVWDSQSAAGDPMFPDSRTTHWMPVPAPPGPADLPTNQSHGYEAA